MDNEEYKLVKCYACQGSGLWGPWDRCRECEGSGYITVDWIEYILYDYKDKNG